MRSRLPHPCRLFLFDLDGTLIDSVADIATSVNLALGRMGLCSLPKARIAGFIGDGMRKLIERSLREVLQREPGESMLIEAMELYQQEYARHLLDSTRLFPGVEEVLEDLRWARLAVVTNKPEGFSRRILEALGVLGALCAVIGGDSIPQRKPNPAPLHEAMRRCGVPPDHTVMVGDSPVDVHAGRAARVFTCGVSSEAQTLRELKEAGCDLILGAISELPAHFRPPDGTAPTA